MLEIIFPVKGQFYVPLTAGDITKITCTKGGLYRLVAVGGDGGYARHYSDQEGTTVYAGISGTGGKGGTVETYKVINSGDVFYYVGGGNGGLTSSIGGDCPYGRDGEAGYNGGLGGKYHGPVTSGSSGGMSYFQFASSPNTAAELKAAQSQTLLNTLAGIAGGGGGGKGYLGRGNSSADEYYNANGGAGGGNPNGAGARGDRKYEGYPQEFQLVQTASQFSWENFGVGTQLSSWGGMGGAGYVCGTDSDNYGGNGGVGWINPLYASVYAKGRTWYSSQKIGHTENAGIYWEKNWITPLVYYGDLEVDSIFVGDREVDSIFYGDREIGS